MPKIHYFQRYSSKENTVTNNTLQLLARVYDYSTSQASKLLSDITGESIDIGIEVNQQAQAPESVPDGAIIQRSFKVLIESKVDSGVDVEQLVRHAKSFQNESQKILLLLTKLKIDKHKEEEISKLIAEHHPDAIFKNVTYEEICDSICDLFKEYEFEMKSIVDDYIEYCNDAELFDQSKYLMRIVPCGKSIEINLKYGIYFHPSDRGYTRHSFVGIYKNKQVQYILGIGSVFDVKYENGKLIKDLIQGQDTNEYDQNIINIIQDAKNLCGYDIEDGHRFFCGKEALSTDYRKVSFGGIQGARLINLKDKIEDFSNAREVAYQLEGMEWE